MIYIYEMLLFIPLKIIIISNEITSIVAKSEEGFIL